MVFNGPQFDLCASFPRVSSGSNEVNPNLVDQCFHIVLKIKSGVERLFTLAVRPSELCRLICFADFRTSFSRPDTV